MERKKNVFDKIGSRIPGYQGYKDRDNRRNCDKLLRVKISDKISNCEKTLSDRMNSEIKKNNLDVLVEIEEYRQRLNTLSDRIKYAPYGESSFFSNTQIKENELQQIYTLDLELYTKLQNSEIHLKDLSFSEIDNFINSIEALIIKRNDFIKECK